MIEKVILPFHLARGKNDQRDANKWPKCDIRTCQYRTNLFRLLYLATSIVENFETGDRKTYEKGGGQ